MLVHCVNVDALYTKTQILLRYLFNSEEHAKIIYAIQYISDSIWLCVCMW